VAAVQGKRRFGVCDHPDGAGTAEGRREAQHPATLEVGGAGPRGNLREPGPGGDPVVAQELRRH
jgi:hypothetical protein